MSWIIINDVMMTTLNTIIIMVKMIDTIVAIIISDTRVSVAAVAIANAIAIAIATSMFLMLMLLMLRKINIVRLI